MSRKYRVFKDISIVSTGIVFSGGREDSPQVEIVKNYYNAKELEEVQVSIRQTGCIVYLSIETLESILSWAKENTIEKVEI
jgi:hypothetical protein